MPLFHVSYNLQNGYIHNWLVAGPQVIPVPDLERFQEDDIRLQIARHYYDEESGIAERPVQDATLNLADDELTWRYVRCADDHFVDLTAFYHVPHYLRAWAYARVVSPASQNVTFVLTTNGPADVWLGDRHVQRHEHFYHQIPHSVAFEVTLEEGPNDILVRFEEVAMRACPYAMALQIQGLPLDETMAEAQVLLPSENKSVGRRKRIETALYAAYVEQDVFAREDEIGVHWPEDLDVSVELTARLEHESGRIYAEGHKVGKPGDTARLQRSVQIPEGAYQIILMPEPREYYDWNLRVRREIGVTVLHKRYSQAPYGTFAERRREALEYAATRGANVFSEIAKMALGRWSAVDTDAIMDAVAGINARKDCSDFYLVGLLGMMHRYGSDPSFPEKLKEPLEECILNFKYWMDEPGSDAMCYWTENHQILFHTCEVLAGQLYPERTFANVGETGRWHREKGERMALSWLRKRASGGFREWDSNCYFEEDLLALSHLADLAENQQVWEMAAVVMDKMLFTMALNSFRGVFGSTHGRSYAPLIKGGYRESTSGIGRLMWGMGIYSERILGTVGMACAEHYELPSIIQVIAADLPDEMWNRERHAGELEEWSDRSTGVWEVNKVTYKTPDHMLCSAQDYRPGEAGVQEHIWQATLGPDAVVFVTHPPCVSEEGSHRPNFWHGNVALPRVAQWKDTLVAVHKLPQNDWLGFTHAYFPLYAFDEHALREGAGGLMWAFVRKGEGYLALTAAHGFELVKQGGTAYRELRSYGEQNTWLCHMGRAALDGSFEEFQTKILAMELALDDLSARCVTLRGESLEFGWEGPLLVSGKEQPLSGFKHYENPYCDADWPASQMQIRFGDQAMELDFES
jgi:hypothetical protein